MDNFCNKSINYPKWSNEVGNPFKLVTEKEMWKIFRILKTKKWCIDLMNSFKLPRQTDNFQAMLTVSKHRQGWSLSNLFYLTNLILMKVTPEKLKKNSIKKSINIRQCNSFQYTSKKELIKPLFRVK